MADPITLGLTGLSTILGLFGSDPDPEAIYQSRLKELTEAINREYDIEANRLNRRADRDIAVSNQVGAREAASLGYSGSVGSFTAPGEASIAERLKDSIEALNASKERQLTQVKLQGLNRPTYNKPNFFDYASALVGAGGKVYNQVKQDEFALETERNKTQGYLDALKSTYIGGGKTAVEGDLNKYKNMSLGSPGSGTGVGSDLESTISKILKGNYDSDTDSKFLERSKF